MKTMCPPGYHHNGFVATHALGYMMYVMCTSCQSYVNRTSTVRQSYVNRTSCAQVHELPQSHCGDNREGTLFS